MTFHTHRRNVTASFLCFALLIALGLSESTGLGADWPQFRGLNRDGKSPETGLLKQWPEGGPRLLWSVEDLGHGYTSVAVSNGKLYTTGLERQTGYLYVYDLNGNRLWKKSYGPGWSGGHAGTRSTPTLDDGLVYVLSGHGLLSCFDIETKERKWMVDIRGKFKARELHWGITESLLIVDDKIICTPGGKRGAVVALNKKTGKTVWVCKDIDEASAYCSPILIERGGRKLVVTMTADHLIGVDAGNGKLLWKHPHDANYDIHAVSPVYEDGRIYITSGYGGTRGAMLELSKAGSRLMRKWTDSNLDCHHGGVVVHDGFIYGASHENAGGKWFCLNLATGKVAGEIDGVGKGSVAYADGMLYGYDEKGGKVGLIKASPDDFRLVSSFVVEHGSGQWYWAHPSIAGGRLYIRHGKALMAYDISAGE